MTNQSSPPIAVQFSNIKKKYKLGMVSGKTLVEDIQSWWARIHGREDPNLPIGVNQRLIGQTFWALNGIDLTIYQGETVGIIGSNGAGKSTLLKILSQVTAPTEGDIDIYGRVASLLEIGMGFHGELSGRDNIYMNGAILGMTRKEIDSVFDDILEFAQIGEFIDTPVKRYSSDMFIRLAFAVAVHLKSEILVCDEILAVGDMAYQTKCLDKMHQAAQIEGRTVLYVSHNMNTIRRLCERCIVLEEGKVVYDGDVDKAISIYMSNSQKSNDIDIDLSKLPHLAKLHDLGVRLEHLQLLDKTLPVYTENECLKILLTVEADAAIDEAVFRLTFRNDSDVSLATTWSETASLLEGRNQYELSIPLEKMAKGVFFADIAVYQELDQGRKSMVDMIQRAFRIEIPGVPVWSTNQHGYFRLPNIITKFIGGV